MKRAAIVTIVIVVAFLGLLALRDEVDRRQGPGIAKPDRTSAALPAHSFEDEARRVKPATTAAELETVHRGEVDRERDAATCRRAMEAVRCERLDLTLQTLKPVLREGQRDPTCRDARTELPPWKLLLDAARRGHVPSMARFAASQAVGPTGSLAEYDLESIAAYRAYGYEFLQKAAASGDGEAILKLSRELIAGGRGTRTVPRDVVRGLAYAQVLLRRADPNVRERIQQGLQNGLDGPPPTHEDWAAAEPLSRTILSPAAEARLEGWMPDQPAETLVASCDR